MQRGRVRGFTFVWLDDKTMLMWLPCIAILKQTASGEAQLKRHGKRTPVFRARWCRGVAAKNACVFEEEERRGTK